MNLLALDTSTDACTVGLSVDDATEVRHIVEPRAHAGRLVPMIRDLLQARSCAVTDLHAVVLGNGPGSFIGMRIGASVAQGLAFGAGLPIVPVSSLAVVAARAFAATGHDLVAVAQDARMGEAYLGWYRRDAKNLPLALGGAVLHDCASPVEAGEPFALAGAAWRRNPEMRDALPETALLLAEIDVPHAAELLTLGARGYAEGCSVEPDRLEPEYVRQQVAKVPAA